MNIRNALTILLTLAGPFVLAACQAQLEPAAEPVPTAEAVRLTEQAVEIMSTDPEQAAELLGQAISLDPYNASAYNNLGVLHLRAGRLFDAAESFEEARKLMPAHPSPRLNLGLVFEHAGRVDDAIAEYRKALEVAEGFVPAMQALSRCQLRHGRADDATTDMLAELAVRGSDESWRAWARQQHLKLADDPDALQ
jgi:Flp pilus assembly protein TadD